MSLARSKVDTRHQSKQETVERNAENQRRREKAQRNTLRTTLTIDDQLFAKAVSLAEPGIEKSELLRECVKAFIQRQSARRREEPSKP